jgi:hypothetical protein
MLNKGTKMVTAANHNDHDHDHGDEENYNRDYSYPKQKTLDIKYITTPIITVVAVVGFFIWLTYFAITQKQIIKNEHEEIIRKIDRSVENTETKLLIFLERQYYISDSIWTKSDHYIWCMKFAPPDKKEALCPEVKVPQRSSEMEYYIQQKKLDEEKRHRKSHNGD